MRLTDVEAVLKSLSAFLDRLVEAQILSKAELRFALDKESKEEEEDRGQRFREALEALRRSLGDGDANGVSNGDDDDDVATNVANGDDVARTRNSCKKCRRQFATGALLRHHLDHAHSHSHSHSSSSPDPSLPFHCCQLCYGCFRGAEDFSSHRCPSKRPGLSSVRPFGEAWMLREHNRFRCGYCREEFRICARAAAHLARCPGGPPFTCELCRGEFDSRRTMDAHKESEHGGELPFRCRECPRRFKLRNSLRKHLAAAHDGGGGGGGIIPVGKESGDAHFTCGRCGKKFLNRLYLTTHMTRFHNVTKPFLCQVCGDTFTTGEHHWLQLYCTYKRNGLTRFASPLFLAASSLKCHLEIHGGTRRFTCQTCGKSFRRKDKLAFHEAIHSGHRPYVCPDPKCKKGFITKTKFLDHTRR